MRVQAVNRADLLAMRRQIQDGRAVTSVPAGMRRLVRAPDHEPVRSVLMKDPAARREHVKQNTTARSRIACEIKRPLAREGFGSLTRDAEIGGISVHDQNAYLFRVAEDRALLRQAMWLSRCVR